LPASAQGDKVLDVAGGTADLSLAFAKKVGPTGQVWLTDINHAMLVPRPRSRVVDKGLLLPVAQCDAEKLPFPDNHFDVVTVAFGLRNMTHKDAAIAEMRRVLKPGGRLLVLEFSKVWKPLAPAYDFYSFKLLPMMGEKVAKDAWLPAPWPDRDRPANRGIGQHGHQTRLHFQQTAGNENQFFLAVLHLDAHGTRLDAGHQRHVAGQMPSSPASPGRTTNSARPEKIMLFRADDVDMNGHGHTLPPFRRAHRSTAECMVAYCRVLAFSKASSIGPTM
jgi:SAM-dependent methyltransferase